MPSGWRRYGALACAVLLCAMGAAWWSQLPYTLAAPIQVAQDFVQNLEAVQYTQAFELTVKQGYVGNTPEALGAVARREFCKVDRLVSTSPHQTHGNRLRRLLLGREVDMPQVQVEFEGTCLLGVTLRKQRDGSWRVYRFASHAG